MQCVIGSDNIASLFSLRSTDFTWDLVSDWDVITDATLFITVFLVFLVTYLFMQNLRATLVPTITIPVSLLATFGVLLASGFTLNMLTLFGIILAVGIVVDDAPFVAIDFEVQGEGEAQNLRFVTQVDDVAKAGPEHPIRVERDPETGEPSPYVLVRADLEALIDRKSFYRLVDLGVHHDGWFGVWSGGQFFGIIPSEELPS